LRQPDWSNIHEQRGFHAAAVPLAALSFLYGLGVRVRLAVCKRMEKKGLPGPVVSIGNLTTGGTGKTPAACMLAEWALGEGYRVVILSRGYGGRYKEGVLVVSDGKDINIGPVKAGDEPYLLARRLPGVPVVISRDRYLAGQLAHEKFGSDFFILDDGFQHMALKRDLDLVLLDAYSPFGNGHLLPWGPLREPVGQIGRADALIITRSGQVSKMDDSEGILGGLISDKPVFRGDHIPEKVIFPVEGREYDVGFLEGKRVAAFAGIARPERFRETLISLGADLVAFRSFGDHHSFRPDELLELKSVKEETDADYLLTTEKDWVRLSDITNGYPYLAYLTIRFDLLSGQERFFTMIRERVELWE